MEPRSSIDILFENKERHQPSVSKFLGTNGIGNTFSAHIINLIHMVHGPSKKSQDKLVKYALACLINLET